jgi:hypothetical protein
LTPCPLEPGNQQAKPSDNPAPLLVSAPILRAMPKLKTINGQPVAKFFKEAVRKK